MNYEHVIKEVIKAEALLRHWRSLPGSQVKMLSKHLITALDLVASYIINEPTSLERDYLTLSSSRIFNNTSLENDFYNTYFYLKALLSKEIMRAGPDMVRITDHKQSITVNDVYFENMINTVNNIVKEVFNP